MEKDSSSTRAVLLHVPEDVHRKVKRYAFEKKMEGKPILERDVYVKAIERGINLITKTKKK